MMDITSTKLSGKVRSEHDLLGDMNIPDEYYFGVQTLRALENFDISRVRLNFFPEIIIGLADTKEAAAMANRDLGILDAKIADAIIKACKELRAGKYHEHFVVDMIQGGAGTSTNMNANEVIANIGLEILGHKKGEYDYCHPNNHVNLSQSTNDAYPTAMKIALYRSTETLIGSLRQLVEAFRTKGKEFAGIIKMGRTQLQDAVPMTIGQEFEAYAANLEREIASLDANRQQYLEINMGATAIGTGINSDPRYAALCTRYVKEVTGLNVIETPNMIEATNDTGGFLMNSSAHKRLAVKLSKICNDLRLIASGPRTGLGEINLPPMQPGSSIMPGKVNPVIPEVVNQIAFNVMGNDTTITMASEAGQLELNVMEPIIVYCLTENIDMLIKGMNTLREKCIVGITANEETCRKMVYNSIGLVTALNPYLGYEASSKVAKEALKTGKGVYDLVLEHKLMSKEELDDILKPENMIQPRAFDTKK
jgi:aspartate ammonia-lyase